MRTRDAVRRALAWTVLPGAGLLALTAPVAAAQPTAGASATKARVADCGPVYAEYGREASGARWTYVRGQFCLGTDGRRLWPVFLWAQCQYRWGGPAGSWYYPGEKRPCVVADFTYKVSYGGVTLTSGRNTGTSGIHFGSLNGDSGDCRGRGTYRLEASFEIDGPHWSGDHKRHRAIEQLAVPCPP
ncbi:hypothetical protein [Thermomonospora umbrina]|uniref:Peptidase inhibitor family I36 n=1 Tax=Thermomonospora umbrina TaxID=111806 RepID=A0A3D9T5E4_9ACTN|nr:hypothetical protein [Thermomonospora umbrina]REE99011.1 hypothetical protein DFJ69_4514 [Thermomonospora umbrina]